MYKRLVNVVFLLPVCLLVVITGCNSAKLASAQEKHAAGEYFEAAAIYRKVYAKTKPQDADLRALVAFQMAECYRLTNNTARASAAYLNALRYHHPDSTVLLRIAQTYHKQGRYPEAISFYDRFLALAPSHPTATSSRIGADSASIRKASPTPYVVQRMDKFNSRKGEFSPMFSGTSSDQLYFASSRPIKDKDLSPSPITGVNTNDIYSVAKDEIGLWTKPQLLEGELNTDFDEATPSFSSDGNTMYYTFCDQDTESNAPRPAQIYRASRTNAQWSKGEKVILLKDTITSLAHPALSPDGNFLYFVSDMIGGFGGKDIYRCRVTNSGFAAIENLGPSINTSADEMFPYLRTPTTLYFASDGHPGFGGLDLFKAVSDTSGQWTLSNLGFPINSSADDFGITFAQGADEGFFSSNRNDPRGYDHIFSFRYPTVEVIVQGFVFDINDNPLEDATIRIVGKDGLNLRTPVRKDASYRIPLIRGNDYVMMAGARGYLNQHHLFETSPLETNQTLTVDFFLTPISQPVIIENIFYDFDQASLRPASHLALDSLVQLLNDNPHISIELAAHTDRKGSTNYNLRLSARRAQSVVDYLTSQGLSPDRLSPKGYGNSTPLTVSKRIADSYPFLPEGQLLSEPFILTLPPDQQSIADQLNRRTEFKVLRTNFGLF
ncbi:MAG: OmpA family protein [Tannerellaceae bacterium]|jgi:peptidoglycan-associated lipoprotein|nr:OmpA family protein [Tannerellaceae bacterium]